MKEKLINIALVLCVVAFVGSGAYLARYFINAKAAEQDIARLIEEKSEENLTEEEIKEAEQSGIAKKYIRLHKKNGDMVGWISVKDSKIDYPVMQTKGDNEFYLHRNFEKEEDVNGLPFLDEKCDINGKNQNLLIYGHHMKSGLMFAKLLDYAEESYYKKHSTITFDTLAKSGTYDVVAAFYSKVPVYADEFSVYGYPGELSRNKFKKYVDAVKASSIYDTGITPSYGQKLLTLVTCSYHVEDGRFVVVAVEKKQ